MTVFGTGSSLVCGNVIKRNVFSAVYFFDDALLMGSIWTLVLI